MKPLKTEARITTRPASECAGPLAVYRRLEAPGSCLLESMGRGLPTTRRSILATRGLLRLELRGAGVRIEPLGSAALASALADRLPDFGPVPADPALTDAERLQTPSVLDALRAAATLLADAEPNAALLPPGIFGALSYEAVDGFEELPPRRPDPLDEADASFVLVADMIVFDHDSGSVQVVTRALPGDGSAAERHAAACAALVPETAAKPRRGAAPGPVRADIDAARFLASVGRLKQHIAAGDIFQAVLSRGLAVASEASSLDVYAALRRANPSPYMFHFDLGDGALLGASPETFLRVEHGEVEIRPIAGTAPRDPDADTDRRLALDLLLDPKEQAEHVMLLDLARNDVARVAEPGTTHVAQQFAIERYSHVQHIVSRVRGTLRRGLDALHAWRAVANMGTLTGAPKLRAMELIREYEPTARGYYGGAAGYFLQDGRFDSCIVIRSLREKNGCYYTRAGAGIVQDSVPERELAETEHKALACLEALEEVAR